MKIIYSDGFEEKSCLNMINNLQSRFVDGLSVFNEILPHEIFWYRNQGKNGGGKRFEFVNSAFILSASINVSQVHYKLNRNNKLVSATALSAIVHPFHSVHSSLHLHISLMKFMNADYYWRIMADLNPSIPNNEQTEVFEQVLTNIAPNHIEEALSNGKKYFYIPSHDRYRGVCHFYLEKYKSNNFEEDLRFAEKIGSNIITTYLSFLNSKKTNECDTSNAIDTRIAYHTLYFFQVVTLDRGTSTGLLAHEENDLGILGSLPAIINKNLLSSWIPILLEPQDLLLERVVKLMPNVAEVKVDADLKIKIADVIRKFYLEFPSALKNQAIMPS